MKSYAPVVVRIGLAIVMLWFGTQQILHAPLWVLYLPDWATKLPISQITFVHMNGYFEVVFGALLLFGFYTRIVAGLLFLHLLGITFTVGYNEIGVRDFGLTLALLSIALSGSDRWSVDRVFGQHSVSNVSQ